MKSTSSRRRHTTPKTTSSKRYHTTRKIPDKNQIFGPEKTRAQVMAEIMAAPDLYRQFQKFSARLQDELVEFAMGVRGLNVTYDPVFKTIFNPETRRERLEEFLSLCMKQKVRILRALPNESQRLTEEGSLLVMDILVQLRSGELVNVEIQRSAMPSREPGVPATPVIFSCASIPRYGKRGGSRKSSLTTRISRAFIPLSWSSRAPRSSGSTRRISSITLNRPAAPG